MHGLQLKIIGFWIDSNLGTISIPPSAVTDTISAIDVFVSILSQKHALRDWSHLAGWLNWTLNVFPWGCPALFELYRKTAGKTWSYALIYINREVVEALHWFKETLPRTIGVHLVDSGYWDDHTADMVMFTDASLKIALSFVYSNCGFLYQLNTPSGSVSHSVDIFFLEQLAIVSALHHAATRATPPRRVLIFSDSLDAVYAFHTLAVTEAMHNACLFAAATIVASTGIDFRVRHINGTDNVRAIESTTEPFSSLSSYDVVGPDIA